MADDIKHPTPNDPDTAWIWIVLALIGSFLVSYYLV